MQPPRRSTPRLIALSAAGAMTLAAVVIPPAAAVDVTHTIADVQGTGTATPLANATVTVEGVVTADHRTGGYSGFYLQTAGSGGTADTTPGASDGIFVYVAARSVTLAIGDQVRVTGVASEYRGLTQINASADTAVIENLGVAAAQPTPVALPDTLVGDAREQYEGMLVAPEGEYLVASTHEASRYGSVWLSAGPDPLVKSTEVARPGPEANAIASQNAARRIVLDDGRNSEVTGTTQPYLTADDPVRTGDAAELTGLPYVLSYGFNLWRLQPTMPLSNETPADQKASFTERNPRPAEPADVGGDVVVAAFNVLNYFTTFSEQDSDARGAANQAEFDVQKAKIVAAITALDADVVALQEIENSVHFGGTPDVALADLVAGLNAAAGADEWAFVPTPAALVGPDAPATDVIMNAVIYRTDAVTPVGESVTDVDEAVWDNAREPIAQTFTTPAGEGSEFTVVANHFKSKSGSGTQPADGQGFFNADRVEQAGAVRDFVAELQASTGVEDVAVLGDLNSYSQEDPVALLTGAGYVDLVPTHDSGAYTYTFDGELGSLDHALATPSLAERVTDADVWHINADEWAGYEYDGAFPDSGSVYRASDHDPVRFGITAGGTGGPVEIDLVGINDFHGRLEANGTTAGAAVLAGAVNAFRAENPATLFVSAGDNIGASTFTSFIQDDVPTIEALNAMGLDASALGNHEFDQGRADLEDRIFPLADFPFLSANVYDRATDEPAFEESWVTEVDGVSVGVIAAVTEDLPTLVTPAGIESLDVRPVVQEVNRVAGELSDGDAANGEADVLVLLVHEGPVTEDVSDALDDSAFGQIVTGASPEIDAIMAGHTHRQHVHQLPVEGWPEGLTRPVVQGGQYSEALAHVTLTVDPSTGDVTANSAEVVPLAPGGTPAYPADPTVAAIVAEAVAVANELGNVSLGQITGDLNRARQTSGSENRGGESTLGNLVADVQLWATQDAGTQIAFMNPGGLRTNLTYASSGPNDPDGNVTYREAANVQPFANTLVTMTLTGDQVVDVLEEQWQPAGASRPFLKLGVAGLTYTYDPSAAVGERVTRVLVGDQPLDPTGAYTVVVNSFLASGGDNFATLADGADKADSGRVDLQAFVDYMEERSPVSPDLAQRAVGVQVVDVPAEGYAPGDTVTANLSSLLFSAGEAQGGQVVLTADGAELGTFPVDPTVVDSTDEVGRAAATFTVPQGVTGTELVVTAAVAETGTEATFALPLAEQVAPTCSVQYSAHRLGGLWLGGVVVTNDTDTTVRGWDLTWSYTQGERVLTGIGAKVRQQGTAVTASSTFLNRTIRPGGSTFFALVGRAPTGPGVPQDFALNGQPCATS